MNLALSCTLSPSDSSTLKLVLDHSVCVLDALYLRDSVARQKISVQLSLEKVMELRSIIDAVLSGNSSWETLVVDESAVSIVVRATKNQNPSANKQFEIKVEKHSTTEPKFITFIDSAKSLCGLNNYLTAIQLKMY